MLSIKESYKMSFKENWSTHGIWIDISGSNMDEMQIMREYILKGFDEIERRKNKKK